MEVLVGTALIALLVGVCGGRSLAARSIAKRMGEGVPLALPPAAPQPPMPEPVPPPRGRDLYELAGILRVHHEDRMGARAFVLKGGREYEVTPKREIGPDLLGHLIADFDQPPSSGRCRYCCGSGVAIDWIARKPPPQGARDAHIIERMRIGRYCVDCGLQLMDDGQRVDWERRPMPFRSTNDLFSALEALACGEGRLTQYIRRHMLAEERARLEPKLAAIATQMSLLDAELHPRLDADPFRGLPSVIPGDRTVSSPVPAVYRADERKDDP